MGKKLRELRLSKGLKAKDVANVLQITERAYYHYEQERREPSIDLLRKLCDFYDVSADYLIGRTDFL